MQKHSLWHTSISVSAGEKHQDAVDSRNKSFLTGTTPPTSWKQHFITCSCPWWDFDSYQSINVSKMGPSLLHNIERNGQKISDYWGMAKVFGRSVLLVFCFHNNFFTAVLSCMQDFCSVVSRGKMEGMHTEGTENKLLTCRFFDYCMLPSVFLNHPLSFYSLLPVFSCSFPFSISPTFLSAVLGLILFPSSFSPHLQCWPAHCSHATILLLLFLQLPSNRSYRTAHSCWHLWSDKFLLLW